MIECYKLTHHIHDPLSHLYKLKKPRFNSKEYQHLFTNSIVILWTGLLVNVADSLHAFKNKLDKHWAHKKYFH